MHLGQPIYFSSVFYVHLYNNTCSFCIFIGRELCVIKVHTHGWCQLMAWSNLANLFRGFSHDFCQFYYNIEQIYFIFLCFCAVIDHRWRHSVWRTKSHALDFVSCVLFCSSHAMASSVIYYCTDARKNEIYLWAIVAPGRLGLPGCGFIKKARHSYGLLIWAMQCRN